MQPGCLFIIIVLGFYGLWLVLKGSNKTSHKPEYFYSVPLPQWKYPANPTPQDYVAANYLRGKELPTKRNYITSTFPGAFTG